MNVLEYLNSHITYMDGPMGTFLQSKGLPSGVRPEVWNIENPEAVINMHQGYFEAGSNIVCTNTFGANGLHFDDAKLEEIIRLAVDHVKEARQRSNCKQLTWIALKVSSLGKLLKPFGDYEFDDAVEEFAKIVKLGVKYGVELIDIETMNDSYETKAALLAAKENCDLPVFVSNTYDEKGRLMTGATPEAMVAMLEGMRADAIGINCSVGPEKMAPLIQKYIDCASIPVFFRPNAGLPKLVGSKTVYDMDPEIWADEVAKMVQKGVRMAGGCCGTTEEFTKALIVRTGNMDIVSIQKKNISWISSYNHTVKFGDVPILNAERINPNSMTDMHDAIRDGDINRIKQEAVKEREEGAQIIDVNVGLPEIDEPKLLQEAVVAIQSVVDNPLVIDTSDPIAMEAALRHYNGKALIDTVNGKEENMKAIFPLAQKYGGMIVALPLDENGIPEKAEDRVKIAERIIARAAEYGIDKKDLIFDPLALTISTDTNAALETLKAIKMIHDMGCLTSLGISNISFGLPERPLLNATFFVMAMDAGLNTGIVNTGSTELLNAYYTYCVLHNYDEKCMKYLKHCQELAKNPKMVEAAPREAPKAVEEAPANNEAYQALREAIIEGFDDEAAKIAESLLEGNDPLVLISDAVIPALDYVGKGFEEEEFFLPELLASADAAQAACGIIKEYMVSTGNAGQVKCDFVLATVQGDVHDIGKNIVKILMENYGFNVFDLGIDVAPETVVEKVVELHAPICGLSALMTTSVPSMEETIKQIAEKAPWCKVVVGGAVLNQEYADKIHAHHYSPDAMSTVRYADEVYKTL
jgi:5-methyltetrahydrofolate--homocysteine methyltransferase